MKAAPNPIFIALLACVAFACAPAPQPPPGESPTAEGEGEGEGEPAEGEGEPTPVPGGDIDVDVSATLASSNSTRADGVGLIEVSVVLVGHDGAPVVGRPVTLLVSGAAHVVFDAPAATDANGRTSTRLRADRPGDAIVVAEMPDASSTARLAALELTFEPCLSLEDSFVHELWGAVFSRCVGCHNEYGLPVTQEWANSNMLKFPGEPDFASANVEMLRALAKIEIADDLNYLVAMPTLRLTHSGGEVIKQGSVEEAMLIGFADRLRQEQDVCGEGVEVPAVALLNDVSLASRRETFARAKLALLGVPLSEAEELRSFDDDNALGAALDELLADPRASNRVVEIYNDWLWTDRFTREVSKTVGGGNIAINRLNAQFPKRRFFFLSGPGANNCSPATEDCCGEPGSPYPGACDQPLARDNAADSLAREPLELVRHIWKNDLSADLIATADFTMVNPYLAMMYGFGSTSPEWSFNDDNSPGDDRNEYKPFVLKDTDASVIEGQPGVGNRYPHAGILTAHATMLRFPATPSNRERRRASRIVFERFLGIDIMKLADFSTAGLPADADLDTATTTEIACTACHSVMDPIGRTLFSFAENGNYKPGTARASREEMFEASFMGERFCQETDEFCSAAISGATADQRDHVGDPVRWLVERVVQNPRFPYAMTLPLFAGLTGAPVLRAPSSPEVEGFAERNLAFAIQNTYLSDLAVRFDQGGRNLKALAKDILMGPYSRAGDSAQAADSIEAKALAIAGVGRGTLITPEQLSRKLLGLTAESVTAPEGGNADLLRDFDQYRLLFGGVNWDSLTLRFRDPNPVMMRIVERMANQVSCRVVVEDFARKDSDTRVLLSSDLTPAQTNEALLRTEIARQRLRLLGEESDANGDEVSALYRLYLDVKGIADAAGDPLPPACRQAATATHDALQNDANGSMRAWMAVAAALLSDPLFFVE